MKTLFFVFFIFLALFYLDRSAVAKMSCMKQGTDLNISSSEPTVESMDCIYVCSYVKTDGSVGEASCNVDLQMGETGHCTAGTDDAVDTVVGTMAKCGATKPEVQVPLDGVRR